MEVGMTSVWAAIAVKASFLRISNLEFAIHATNRINWHSDKQSRKLYL